jgi:hypothetical protein
MNFNFPFIDILTLPIDAGSGEAHIVIDGINGTISIFDSTGFRVGYLGPGEPPLSDDFPVFILENANGLRVRQIATSGFAGSTYRHEAWAGKTFNTDAQISAQLDDAIGRSHLVLTTSEYDNMGRARIFLTMHNPDNGESPRMIVDASDGTPMDIILNGVTLGRGEQGTRFQSVASDVARAPGANTDMVVTANVFAGRRYDVHLHTGILTAAGAGGYIAELTVNGTVRGAFIFEPANTQNEQTAICSFDATVDIANAPFRVINSAASAGNITLQAGANSRRHLAVFDVGET